MKNRIVNYITDDLSNVPVEFSSYKIINLIDYDKLSIYQYEQLIIDALNKLINARKDDNKYVVISNKILPKSIDCLIDKKMIKVPVGYYSKDGIL